MLRIINEKNDYSDFDAILNAAFCGKLIKILKFNDSIDYFKYPASFKITQNNFIEERRSRGKTAVLINCKFKETKRLSNKCIVIQVPGDEIFDQNYVHNIDVDKIIKSTDLIIASNERIFFEINKLVKYKVKTIVCKDLFDRNGSGNKRFLKICDICLNLGDAGLPGLYHRLGMSDKLIEKANIVQGRYSIIEYIKRGLLFKGLENYYNNFVKNLIIDLICDVSKLLPLESRTIVFRTFQQSYCCNPKYICEELISRNNENFKYIWIANKKKVKTEDFPGNVKVVQQNSFLAWYYLCCAKVLVDNNVRQKMPEKRKGQIYVQTWHGSLGIKKFTNVWSKDVIKIANLTTDCLISNSQFETNVYRESCWPTAAIYEFGHPRNDIFYSKDINRTEKIRSNLNLKYGISKQSKIILYAPTFRDQHLYGSGKQKKDLSMFLNNYQRVIEACNKRFGGEFVILVRLHSHLRLTDIGNTKTNVFNVSDYPDIQELQLVTSVGITDYSSWIYDYILLRRPGFIFATDAEKYLKERELYFPIKCTPFPFSDNEQDLLNNIITFDEAEFKKSAENFLVNAGCKERGIASKKVVDLILEKME